MSEFEGSRAPRPSQFSMTIIIWGCLSIILAFLMLKFNTSAIVLGATFWSKALAFLVASVLGLVGSLLGDAIRRFAAPDMLFTSGMGSLIWQKIFWLIGPQSIGCFVGVGLGVSIILGLG